MSLVNGWSLSTILAHLRYEIFKDLTERDHPIGLVAMLFTLIYPKCQIHTFFFTYAWFTRLKSSFRIRARVNRSIKSTVRSKLEILTYKNTAKDVYYFPVFRIGERYCHQKQENSFIRSYTLHETVSCCNKRSLVHWHLNQLQQNWDNHLLKALKQFFIWSL